MSISHIEPSARSRLTTISGGLKDGNRSQVAFMPYGIVLKDERRTSNIQRRMKNEYPITNIQPVESLKVVRRLFLF
ncbi:MAG: hypothetical protein JW883_07175, partial [Deltaproteobacteria bacterium]|nr:hypothetical protein [Deltaproteobacteria bacterium]